MDLSRRSVALCAEGTLAEHAGDIDAARRLFDEAWLVAADAYDRAVAAHYVAHLEPDPAARLAWNQRALDHALRVEPALVETWLGSLYVNLGDSYERLGDSDEAHRYYALAAQHGVVHAGVSPRD